MFQKYANTEFFCIYVVSRYFNNLKLILDKLLLKKFKVGTMKNVLTINSQVLCNQPVEISGDD